MELAKQALMAEWFKAPDLRPGIVNDARVRTPLSAIYKNYIDLCKQWFQYLRRTLQKPYSNNKLY